MTNTSLRATAPRRVGALLALLALLLAVLLAGQIGVPAPSAVGAAMPGHDKVVGEAPPASTPAVHNGKVLSVTQVGDQVVLGGTFDQASSSGSDTVVQQPYLLAFDAATGELSASFTPRLDGRVESVIPGPAPGTVYVGGAFTHVDGQPARHIAALDLRTGELLPGFSAPSNDGVVNELVASGGRLFVGGDFDRMGGAPHRGFAALDPRTGEVDAFVDLQVSGHHNDSGSGAQGAVGVRELAVTPDGDRLVAIGNFKYVDGLLRDQLVVVDLDGTSARVAPDWATDRYSPYCFSWAFDSYVRGLDVSPDGSYFVVAGTGGHNTGTLCDTAARFELDATGTDIQPTWVNYSGGDTLWAVEVTETAVYVGGHQRWLNNPHGSDYAAPGAVPRPGLAALDPGNGMPLQWNPGRHPRGGAVFDLHATEDGLWLGSDSEWIGHFEYRRERVAYFRLEDGSPVAPTDTGELPGPVFLAGRASEGPQAPPPNTLREVRFDGNDATVESTTGGGLTWDDARGAVMIGGTVFYGWRDGTFRKRSLVDGVFGDEVLIDPYGDPEWAGVGTGSGNTYDGVPSQFYDELSNVTGLFYRGGRLYYTMAGQHELFWRWFTPDSGTVGASRFTASGGLDWSDAGEMFIAGDSLYVASRSTGALRVTEFGDEGPTGTFGAVAGTDHVDWRAAAAFLYAGAPPPPNQSPVARFIPRCEALECAVDAAASGDPDGTIASYAWDFGDGATGSGVTARHTYAEPGSYDVELTVTDDAGDTDTRTSTVQVGAVPAGGVGFVGADSAAGARRHIGATVPDDTRSGDVLLLFLSRGGPEDELTEPLGVAGWRLVDAQVSGTMVTRVWSKVADADDAGAVVSFDFAEYRKVNLQVAAYTGTDPDDPIASYASAVDGGGTDHQTPPLTGQAGRWVVSYWADKSSSTTRWTAPPGQTVRSVRYDDGGGRITALLTDEARLSAEERVGGLTASVDQPSGRATMWTLSLAPAPAGDEGGGDEGGGDEGGDPPAPDPEAGQIEPVGVSSVSGARIGARLPVPEGSAPGDLLLLFVSRSSDDDTIVRPGGAGEWRLLGTQPTRSLVTRVWGSTVGDDDVGGEVALEFTQYRKLNATLVTYTGTHASTPVAQVLHDADVRTAEHTTPAGTIDAPAWVVSYWADKSSTTQSWSAPAGLAVRQETYDGGRGRVTSLLADSGAPRAAGPVGGHTAITDAASSLSTAWTLVLTPTIGGGSS